MTLTHGPGRPPVRTPGVRPDAQLGTDVFAGREPVIIRFDDGHVATFGADRIEHGQSLVLDVLALSPGGAERLHALHSRVSPAVYASPPTLAVAFGAAPAATAMWGRLRNLGREIAAGTTRWRLTLEPLELTVGVMDDMTFNSVGPDDIAGWRSRRILLDERSTGRRPGDPMPNGLAAGIYRDPTLEMVLSGAMAASGRDDGRSLGAVEGSPIPSLFATWTADRAGFLTAARLVATLWLVLTRTVERVRRLDLQFVRDDRLSVDFEGTRRRVYTDREPAVIIVEGECPLHGATRM